MLLLSVLNLPTRNHSEFGKVAFSICMASSCQSQNILVCKLTFGFILLNICQGFYNMFHYSVQINKFQIMNQNMKTNTSSLPIFRHRLDWSDGFHKKFKENKHSKCYFFIFNIVLLRRNTFFHSFQLSNPPQKVSIFKPLKIFSDFRKGKHLHRVKIDQ